MSHGKQRLWIALLLVATQAASRRGIVTQQAMEPERAVLGQTIASNHDPAARLHFAQDFRYAGGQRFILYGTAEAEQHFFVEADSSGAIHRLFWVQFEHYLPGANGHYTYQPRQLVKIGPFEFITDTKVFANYGKSVLDPDSREESDQARAGRLLSRLGFTPPAAAVRARMFYLPDSTRRAELMVIYVEALSPTDIAGREVPAESPAPDHWPDLADRVVRDAARALSIER